VNKVLEKRTKNGTLEYRIRWLDSSPWKNTYEPLEHIESPMDEVQNLERDRKEHSLAAKVPNKKGQRKEVVEKPKARGRPRRNK